MEFFHLATWDYRRPHYAPPGEVHMVCESLQRLFRTLNSGAQFLENSAVIQRLLYKLDKHYQGLENQYSKLGRQHRYPHATPYIYVQVNGRPCKALVESGVPSTIMSKGYAKQCGLLRFLDPLDKGTAHGVAQSEILGKVHSALVKIGDIFYPCSFWVWDSPFDMHFLFGLDMLREHKCVVDLEHNFLILGGDKDSVHFLLADEADGFPKVFGAVQQQLRHIPYDFNQKVQRIQKAQFLQDNLAEENPEERKHLHNLLVCLETLHCQYDYLRHQVRDNPDNVCPKKMRRVIPRNLSRLAKSARKFEFRYYSFINIVQCEVVEELAHRDVILSDNEAQKKTERGECHSGIDEGITTYLERNLKSSANVARRDVETQKKIERGECQAPYVDMEVNGHRLKAFVHSGLSFTIMSKSCAERCGLMGLLDKTHKGIAVEGSLSMIIAYGMCEGEVLGILRSASVKIGDKFYQCEILVMGSPNTEFLFGLDMLCRHKCRVDFVESDFIVGDEDPVPFLTTEERCDKHALSLRTSGPDFEAKVTDMVNKGYRREGVICALRYQKQASKLHVPYIGEPMAEILDVVVNNSQTKSFFDVRGEIRVKCNNNVFGHYLCKMDKHERMEPGQSVLLTGPPTYISALDGFAIKVNLSDEDGGVISSGEMYCQPDRKYLFEYDTPMQKKISGENGSATVRYIVWADAVGAVVHVRLIDGDDEGPVNIFGTLDAWCDKVGRPLKPLTTSTLFLKSMDNYTEVKPGGEISLSRKVVAVSKGSSLVVSADLYKRAASLAAFPDLNISLTSLRYTKIPRSSVEFGEIARGSASFPVQSTGTFVDEIDGFDGKIEVTVTFTGY